MSENLSQVAVINLILGNKLLNRWNSFFVPQSVISIEHSIIGTGAEANTASIKIYHHMDPLGEDVTGMGTDINSLMEAIASVLSATTTHVNFSYGYNYITDIGEAYSEMSPVFSCIITDIQFTLNPMGITYSIEAKSSLVEILSEQYEGAYNWYQDPEGKIQLPDGIRYSDAARRGEQMSGHLKVIWVINSIFISQGYSVEWSRYPNNLENVTEADIESLLTQTTEGTIDFVKDVLAQLAYKESDTVSYCNYTFFIDDATNTITIGPASEVQTDDAETPINTRPYTNSVVYDTYYYYYPNADVSKYGKNQIISQNLQYPLLAALTSYRSGSFQGEGYDGQNYEISFDAYTESNSLNIAQRMTNFAQVMNKIPSTGTITIPGDPNVIPMMTVIKIVMYIGNQLFFLSGDYIVLSKTDVIENGIFRTTLMVFKQYEYSDVTTQPGGNGPIIGKPNLPRIPRIPMIP